MSAMMSAVPPPQVAYFCMEYGLDASLTIYSGGLGVLAGDYMKSAGDLSSPITGIGLMWGEGYTCQRIDAEGKPVDSYVPTRRDAVKLIDGLELEVEVGGRSVPLRVFRVTQFTKACLYLLEPARDADKWITARLYGGGEEDRLAQEIVLGVGGVRLLRALGLPIDVYHFNEGHAVFAGMELLRERIDAGETFETALSATRESIVFTTHTPVAAGNEIHEHDIIVRLGADVGLGAEVLHRLGGTPFSMTEAGLRLARSANAVAALHGETARVMWAHVEGGAPIVGITNGVHAPTWQDARIRAATVTDKTAMQRRRDLWHAHQDMKRELLAVIEQRTGVGFDVNTLLIGFARRAAPYKRADLIFRDPARVEALMERGMQLVFSGKAHPADDRGKALVSRLVAAMKRWPKNVVFLENYDMTLGAALTRGCDVWLNNPRRPMEASGTSGMKAAMNGVPNLSILDGWWPEGCRHGETGWQIGDTETEGDDAARDSRDAAALYATLADEVVPRYYEHHDAWVTMMIQSIGMSRWRFSSDRMIEDYFRLLYAPRS